MGQFDVIVVGAGSSGISAALTAAQNGQKVALLEKGDKFGGAGMFGAQGLFGAETKAQAAEHVEYTREGAFKEILDYTHYRSNARMVKAIVDESSETIDWMAENGLATELVTNTQEVHQNHPRTYHQYIDKFNGFQRLIDRFLELDGQLFTKTSGKEILVDKEGKVSGLVVESGGQEQRLDCSNIILADGGFIGDQTYVADISNIRPENLYSMGERKATGDGLRMLGEIDGVNNYRPILENHAASVVTGPGNPWQLNAIATLSTLPLFWVDQTGKRFVNEDVVYDFALWGNATVMAGGYYYILFDQQFVDYISQKALDWTGSFTRTFILLNGEPMNYQTGPLTTLNEEIESHIDQKVVFKTNSIAELAAQTGINPETLQQTIAQHNNAVELGKDDEFYKDRKFVKFGLETGPFYALKAISTTLGSVGGAYVDESFNALKRDGSSIPGVYVVGNNAAGMFDSTYPTIEGLSNAFAWNSGRIAAKAIGRKTEKEN